MGLTPTRIAELEAARAALRRCVDLLIDNYHDDGREGGSISEGPMPTLDDLIDCLHDMTDLATEDPSVPSADGKPGL